MQTLTFMAQLAQIITIFTLPLSHVLLAAATIKYLLSK